MEGKLVDSKCKGSMKRENVRVRRERERREERRGTSQGSARGRECE
jgi:hypothetical protein